MLSKLALIVGTLFSLGAALILLSQVVRHGSAVKRKEDWIKYGTYFAIISSVIMAAYLSRWLLAVMLLAITIGGSMELKGNLKLSRRRMLLILLPFSATVNLCLGHLLLGETSDWFASFAFVFLLVAISDSFAQLWGRLAGCHKLCPRLSPGKTWEGCIGGVISTVAGAVALATLLPNVQVIRLALMGGVIAMAATAGDLLFSFVKRKLGIKDFSSLLPGHGGILDRFDSLIVAAPVSYWIGKLLIK